MELSRRRFMQAAGAVVAGGALDIGLPALARASTAPIPLTGTPSIYSGWTKVPLPPGNAMQCFGFNGSTVYTCQNNADDKATPKVPSTQLTFSQFKSPSDGSPAINRFATHSHGGQIGNNGPTIWTPCSNGAKDPVDGHQITRGDFNPDSDTFEDETHWSPPLTNPLTVNVNTSNLVVRDGNNKLWVYDLAAVKSSGSGTFPPSIGSFQIPGSPSNLGYDVTGNWLYWATQTDAQQDDAKFTVGFHNFVDGSGDQQAHNMPTISGSSYELEGLAILPDGSKWVVGVNNGFVAGSKTVKSFSLVTVT
ncbi:MAG TPA: hypothetical protein VG708_10425 [Mycobacteriales bacterium]|nr:hypothetical protein [Mycobacteriales bacterium]